MTIAMPIKPARERGRTPRPRGAGWRHDRRHGETRREVYDAPNGTRSGVA